MEIRNTKKIAIFLPDLTGGGAEHVLLMLSKEFIEKGYSVDLLLGQMEGDLVGEVYEHVNIILLSKKKYSQNSFTFGIDCLYKLIRYVRDKNPDCLLSSLTGANIIALLASLFARPKKIIVREASTLANIIGRYPVWLVKALYSRADEVIAISNGVAKDLEVTLKVKSQKINVIYNPVDVDRITKLSLESPVHPWLDEKNIPVIMGCGRLSKEKDFSVLIKAFSLVKKKINARLVILGEGCERKNLEKLIENLGLSDYVSMPGFVVNPYSYMARSSLLALSSRWEGLGNVLIESLALKLPIVSTNCPFGPAEILQNGRLGELVPVGNELLMAEAMLKSIEAPPDRRQDSGELERYSLENIANQYLRVLFD